MDNLESIIQKLKEDKEQESFSLGCKTIVSEIQKLPFPSTAIKPLLRFMCENPTLDYGMPGALVRFIESFPEDVYVDDLIQTIQKQPTEHNTWMLLRIMNTWNSPRQKEYIAVMKSALSHPNISEELMEDLKEDLEDFEE